ncbi:far upstream element-binding protein 3 isoform X7 [Sus scrofa]|uniref:far upstream element-binding protein 3 isoform X7 n=1 Tax=Sus scrofa TaxID=9823 RepID=UPI000A2B73C0|nr:far upstream element-binding protein 3 isoform X7 [Sus scrofa]
MTSPTALDQTASGNGGVATRPQRRDGSLTRWTRPRARGPAPTSGRTAVTCPDPSPADAATLASASLLASLPPEVGRLSLSGYGSPSGAGGRTGEPGGGGGCGGGGSGGGNGGAGAGAERSGGDEGRGLRGRPAPCPAVGNQLGALVHQRAVITEEFKVPDKMVGFIIGRGGEQISRIQAESGCKIQIASESSGIPERPCVLTGTPESIEQAKRLLGQIVDRCRNGPGFHNDVDGSSTIQELLIPASKVGLVIGKGGETIKQLQERTGVKMVMIQDGPLPTGADKPLRITGDPFKVQQAREMVLEIIREKDQADFRGVRGDFSSRMGGGSIEVSVPRFAVGIVIGRNGEMIKKIQNDAGVRIQFKPDDGISPERAAQVMGPPDRCQHAAHVISELILTAQERDGFGGLAVARGRGRGRGDWSVGTPGGIQEITYTVPADKCGLVIGKGGENIKSINQQSGAHVELQRNPPPNTDPGLRVFTIRGVPQQIEVARHLIDEKVGGSGLGAPGAFGQSPFSQPPAAPHQNTFPPRSSGCFPNIAAKVNGNPHGAPVSGPPAFLTQGWGSTYQAWQQPAQQVPSHAASAAPQASSPPDYTMAWAEYYRQQVAFYGQTLGQAQAHSQEQ